ncbi:hypothetical protein BDB01DRAFT_785593 [Pilobolus umbonatus]|nr:hypothetical protein BDB01DRAFT_785593 [Pilobolus umbonatus]
MDTDRKYQFPHYDDDAKSTGGDSGYSMGLDDVQQKKVNETDESKYEKVMPVNFISRVAFIPIVHDSIIEAQKIVRQHDAGQRALEFAETAFVTISTSAQTYLPSTERIDSSGGLLYHVNDLGNKSLDILERHFPIVSAPTNEIIQPLTETKDQISNIVNRIREKIDLNTGIDYMADQLEVMLDQYLPDATQERDMDRSTGVGTDRLVELSYLLSSRLSKKLAHNIKSSGDEEKQLKEMFSSWVTEQINTVGQQKWLMVQEKIEGMKTRLLNPLQAAYEFTQTEIDKVYSEITKEDMTFMERAKTIVSISQNDLIHPLLHQYRATWYSPQSFINNEEQKKNI